PHGGWRVRARSEIHACGCDVRCSRTSATFREMGAGVLLLPVPPPAPGGGEAVTHRERPEAVAPLLRTLRADRLQPRVLGTEPRRVYVLVTQLTPERRAALEAAGL